ncbi:hypothetical protein CIB48_g1441 [Xylaria polymorpha]|nr:hypothetical protein CIB48_g1441 [Xylaria polymorpha]
MPRDDGLMERGKSQQFVHVSLDSQMRNQNVMAAPCPASREWAGLGFLAAEAPKLVFCLGRYTEDHPAYLSTVSSTYM